MASSFYAAKQSNAISHHRQQQWIDAAATRVSGIAPTAAAG
jgi:hypothetical protein